MILSATVIAGDLLQSMLYIFTVTVIVFVTMATGGQSEKNFNIHFTPLDLLFRSGQISRP